MKIVKQAFQPYIGKQLKVYREKQSLSQEAMSRKLCISLRSYIDLEHGKTGVSALTLTLFLLLLSQEEQRVILQELKECLPLRSVDCG